MFLGNILIFKGQELANQQENSDVMIQLPWTLPQQENTQAMILQQPNGQKVYLDLNHSTDTTAIWSFIAAMIASTLIAIWYGRKSFKLTEMSFKTVIQQIQASEQSALSLNSKLFEQQLILQNRLKELEIQKNIIDRFRCAAETFIIDVELFLSSVTLLHLCHEQFKFSEQVAIGSYEYEVFIGINKKFDQLFESRSKLLFSALEMEASTYDEIDQAISETIRIAVLVKNRLVRGRDKLMNDVQECQTTINKNKVIFKRILEKEVA